MLFFSFTACSGGEPKGFSSSDSRSDSGSDADSDADTDSDTDADTDSDTGADVDTSGGSGTDSTAETGVPHSGGVQAGCGDPSLSYTSLAVPVHGGELSEVSSLDLCITGDEIVGWSTLSGWDDDAFAFQGGWQVISASSPSQIVIYPGYGTDASWHIEFSGFQLLDGDGPSFGIYDRQDWVAPPLDVAVDYDRGRLYLFDPVYGWDEAEVYGGHAVVSLGSSWDVDYDEDAGMGSVP